jgi:hypothetical protein
MIDEDKEAQYEIEVGDENESETEVSVSEVEDSSSSVEEPVQEESSDHEEYASSVQKRIDKLTKKMREAERREQAALEYAQNVQSEVNTLKNRVHSIDEDRMSEYGKNLTREQQQAEEELKRAVDLGDSDSVVAAQRKITQLAIAEDRYRGAMSQRQAAMQTQAQQPQGAQYQQPQAPVRPDPKAEEWAEKNEWFGQDEAMTFAAFGIHKKLVEQEGFDPKGDDYYHELDKRIQVAFPHKFNGTGKRPAQAVAGVSRTSNTGRSNGKVRLSRSQVAIAKKLGVPLEEYAKYVKD